MAQQYRNNNNHRNAGRDNRLNNQRPPEAEVKVTSPYNFVPLNKEVYFPSWGQLVSHDVPFDDGLSGSFEVEIEAKSPIFIRGTQINGDKYYESDGEKNSTEFMHFIDSNGQKRYFIPGSSFRNMIRSVVEILGFGKLNFVNEMDDFSFRDLNNSKLYTLQEDSRSLNMGWLFRNGTQIYIMDSGKLGNLQGANKNTIPYNRLDRSDGFDKNGKPTFPIQKKKTLKEIYDMELPLSNYPKAHNFVTSKEEKILVLTRHMGKKSRQFLFSKPKNDDKLKCKVDQQTFDKFLKAYKKSEDWKFWESKFYNNRPIPVFFRLDESDNVIDFGLTVLYKMAYKKGIIDTINQQQPERNNPKPDLAETIFGKTENDKLKSRVFFSHAFTSNAKEGILQELILGSPKPTFYPFYIKQDVNPDGSLNGEYNTLNDKDAKISGRKRYAIHDKLNISKILPQNNINNNEKSKVKTSFIPLESGTRFTTKIAYHNLKPVELGALLSALTFHNSKNCCHNIGLAKPYGFGKIEIKIRGINEIEKNMQDFENEMIKFDVAWKSSLQIKELIAMAIGISPDTGKLKYPDLKNFAKLKTPSKRQALPLFSDFTTIKN